MPTAPSEGMVLYRAHHQFHSHYRARQAGTLDEAQWSKILPFIRFHLTSEPGLDWWQWVRQEFFDDEFVGFIDNEIRALKREPA